MVGPPMRVLGLRLERRGPPRGVPCCGSQGRATLTLC